MTMSSARWSRLVRVASVAVLSASGAVALVPSAASAATSAVVDDAGCRTSTLARNDDGSTGAIALPSTLHFYDRDVSNVYVNNNGNLSFNGSLNSFSGHLSTLTQPVIAPFFSDVDTRFSPSGVVTYGTTTYGGRTAFCANWPGVRAYPGNATPVNSFQVYLVDRSDVATGDFDVIFNYNQVQWETGSAALSPAQVGFNAADGSSEHVYVFPGSGTSGAFLDSNTSTGLVRKSRESDVAGRYVFRFRAGRPAGLTPPDTTITSQPAARSTSTSAAFTYSSSVDASEHQRFECRLTASGATAAAFATCPDAGRSYADLADGTYTFQVRAVDAFYSADATPASATFTVDATGPTTNIDTKPASPGNDTSPSFTWSSTATDVASYECRLDGPGTEGSWAACADDQQYDALADGSWTFAVRATDDLGTLGAVASYDFTIDTDAPATTFTTTAEALSNDTTPTFAWTSEATDVESYECQLSRPGSSEPSPWETCTSGDPLTDLADGDWTFKVRATDTAGNTGEAVSHDFTIDTAGPDTVLEDTPKTRGNDTTPSFTWSSTATDVASYECLLDGPGTEGTWTACTSGDSLGDLADGEWTFQVRATDTLGNTGTPASYDFTIDTDAPATTFTTTAEALSNDTTPTFAWTSEATDVESYECQLSRPGSSEPSPWETCTSGDPLTDLADGDWTFKVRATDTAGNTGEAVSHDFTIDTAGPDTVLEDTPKTRGNDTTPSFTWSSTATDVASYECLLDGPGTEGTWTACTSGDSLGDLADGEWTFQVRATDTLGNTGTPASYDFTIDTDRPAAPVLTSTPRALGNDTTPSFTWTSDVADLDHFECLVGAAGARSGSPTACDAAGLTSTSLADGAYTFSVVAIDKAGNASAAASYDFTVDTVAPETTITTAPAAVVATGSVTFGFGSDKVPSSFECRLVAAGQTGDWQSCAGTSKAFTGLAAGAWTFEVRATDAAGNTDATPASQLVTVDLAQPTITASLSSKHPITKFGWHRGPVTITYTCEGNGSAVVACPAPRVVTRAQRGRTFTASVRTADGDTATVATRLYIDKGAPKAAIKGFDGKRTYTSVPKKVRCVASDPRSGLANCTVTVKKVTRKNGDKLIVVRAKAVDKAGNVRVVKKRAPFRAA